jgi:hypothetical protein
MTGMTLIAACGDDLRGLREQAMIAVGLRHSLPPF